MERSTWAAAGAVVLFALCTGASAQTAEKYVPMPVGSTWTAKWRNTGSYTGPTETRGRVVQVTWKGQPHLGFEGALGTTVAQPSGHWIAVLGADGKPVQTWDPPLGFEWPLAVGKSWTNSFTWTNHVSGQAVPVESRSTVEAYEDVTVPAGTFKAFRIRFMDSLGNDNLTWFNPEHGLFVKQQLRRTERSPQGPGTREAEMQSIVRAN